MGFSIGRFLKKIAGPVLSVLPIPGAAFLGTAVTAAFSAPRGPAAPFPIPTGGSQRGPTVLAGGGGVSTLPGGALVPMLRAAGGFIASLLARASATIGKRMTKKGVISLSREVGIAAAATALGLTAVEIAQIIASKPTRRRRGITASQISTTKATMRRLNSLNSAIAKACPPPAARRAAIRRK